jgi:cyclopropane-fatty-acyl-phospholipid synthase
MTIRTTDERPAPTKDEDGRVKPQGPTSSTAEGRGRRGPAVAGTKGGVAAALKPLLDLLLGPDPVVRIEFWDGTATGPPPGEAVAIGRFRDARALRRVLYRPNDLGFGRAYVAGGLEVEGDLFEALRSIARVAPADWKVPPRVLARTVAGVARHGVLGLPVAPPPEEARLRGRTHSRGRDAAAIAHHYDVSNEFYRLVLGPTMTYSCARFVTPEATLEDAQEAKYDLICRKLGLAEGQRLLDVGSGWGGMVIHAARHYRAQALGATISRPQWELARRRIAEADLTALADVELADYRVLPETPFDAISSIGMFEHVGHEHADEYFNHLYRRLRPGGRLLNHAISTPEGSVMGKDTFMARYVFPDGALHDVGDTIMRMEKAGFEVRDVESLREHYAMTLRHWVTNLESNWMEAVDQVGERRARAWHIYMIGAAVSFEENEIAIHQVLGVRPDSDGSSGMPLTRAW